MIRQILKRNSISGKENEILFENGDHMYNDHRTGNVIGAILIIFICLITIITLFFTSCTLSFQNVMTSGTASDVVDSDPKTDAKVDSKISIPDLLM